MIAAELPNMETWWDFSKTFGAGACGVLGPLCVMLWRVNREESVYSRKRDTEMTVQSLQMVTLIEKMMHEDDHRDAGLKHSMQELKTCITDLREVIQRHLERK